MMSRVGSAKEFPLQAEIDPKKTTVKNGEVIWVSTKLKNIRPEIQVVQSMSCSYYESWVSDQKFVEVVTWACEKNAMEEYLLKPGEVREKALQIKINVPAEELTLQQVTFKLGYKPQPQDNQKEDESSIIWSNPATIHVQENLP